MGRWQIWATLVHAGLPLAFPAHTALPPPFPLKHFHRTQMDCGSGFLLKVVGYPRAPQGVLSCWVPRGYGGFWLEGRGHRLQAQERITTSVGYEDHLTDGGQPHHTGQD